MFKPMTMYEDGMAKYKVTESTLDAIRDSAIQLLEGLGINETEVALNLTQAGIKGSRKEAGSCPVANYLRKQLDLPCMFHDISVQNEWSYVWGAEVENPKAVAAFVKYFDEQCYPELDDGDGNWRDYGSD